MAWTSLLFEAFKNQAYANKLLSRDHFTVAVLISG